MKRISLTKAYLLAVNVINHNKNSDCTICRCSINTNSSQNQEKGIDSIIVQNICGHSFHEECINPWKLNNNRCPICSADWIKTLYIS